MNKYFVFGVFSILFVAVASFNVETTAINGTDISDSTEIPDSEYVETFQKLGKNFYLIESKFKRTWQDAVHYCRTQGAHLASIESNCEWKALNSYLMAQNFTGEHRTWIGANDIDTPFEFFWISTGQPMRFTKWLEGEPNNQNGNEACVHLLYKKVQYEMNDLNCKKKEHYICKF